MTVTLLDVIPPRVLIGVLALSLVVYMSYHWRLSHIHVHGVLVGDDYRVTNKPDNWARMAKAAGMTARMKRLEVIFLLVLILDGAMRIAVITVNGPLWVLPLFMPLFIWLTGAARSCLHAFADCRRQEAHAEFRAVVSSDLT